MWKDAREMAQFRDWVDGNSRHDEHHCPDFSCCSPEMRQPREVREAYWDAYVKDDKRTCCVMMMGWMQRDLRHRGINAVGVVIDMPNAGGEH